MEPYDQTPHRAAVAVNGVHLSVDGAPFAIRGATYGSFVPRAADGALFPPTDVIRRDFADMADVGLNTVRTYTAPTADLLDAAADHGLRVIAGVHYDDWRMRPDARDAEILGAGLAAVRDAIEVCDGHPAAMAICVGNEVPADLVRTLGARRVEKVLSRLVEEVHRRSDRLLATYANYPTTEYLRVDGQDFASFNVFLEDTDDLQAYLRRLQVQAGETPVLLSEVGLAGAVHGEHEQAQQLGAQLRVVDEVGLAGACVFSWTDEWGVDGKPVEGWGFGLTTVEREPKLAMIEIREWASRSLTDLRETWPRVSVIVCAYNEQATITECLGSLAATTYPDLEVLVCDDGSEDNTLELARAFEQDDRFKILNLPHAGLSAARNAGLDAASGEIIAYLDADAACHPQWVHHLALSLEDPAIAATGGPNLGVPGAGLVERAVAASPGSPQHVLVSHDRAEHVPGCNMAFRASALRSIGGFNVAYTSAGDDVDVCWKLLDRGLQIGFAPAAMVLHHRRGTAQGYLRQQRGYGRSEKMLQGPHAHRFNQLGQARWAGVIYTNVLRRVLRPVVYHGTMGVAPYQPVTRLRGQHAIDWLGAMLPLALPVFVLGLLGMLLHPVAGVAAAVSVLSIAGYAGTAFLAASPQRHEPQPLQFRALVAWFHVAQPFVRTWGRLRAKALPIDVEVARPAWTGDRFAWLDALASDLQARALDVRCASPTDDHDLRVSRTPLARSRVGVAVLWQWTPVVRRRTRPTLAALVVAASASGAALAIGPLGWVLLAVVLVGTAADTFSLDHQVRTALRATTSAAQTVTDPATHSLTRQDVSVDL